MNTASKLQVMGFLTPIIVIIIIAKLTSLLLVWLLPNEGVDYYAQKKMLPPYRSYSIGTIIEPQVVLKDEKIEEQFLQSGIGTMLLQGIYRKKDSGYIIVSMKSKPQNSAIIALGESYSGYKLVKIKPSSAIFEKDSHLYTLELIRSDLASLRKQHAPFIDGEPYRMSRLEIQKYAQNFGQILKDINIIEVKNRGKIKGFKITKIRQNTPFSYLGLRKGDIIIKVNNKTLTSYADALNIYQNIDDINEIELLVLRDNQEKELRYEIY